MSAETEQSDRALGHGRILAAGASDRTSDFAK
jgi:hypothetical protein